MARRSIPYPPSPTDYPDELTRPDRESAGKIAAVVAGLSLFLFVYLGLIVGSLALILATTTSLSRLPYPVLWVLASIVAAIFALVLIKGLFAREAVDKTMHVEIEEDDQPVFFSFIRRLTDEIGAPRPNKVFVTPEVNASVVSELSLLNLFVPPKRNLVVGLPLVNSLNLSEFKAVMGHEFGHFSQKTSRLYAYVYLANRVMINLIAGEDWLDRAIRAAKWTAKYSPSGGSRFFAAAFVLTVGGTIWVVRKVMVGLLLPHQRRDPVARAQGGVPRRPSCRQRRRAATPLSIHSSASSSPRSRWRRRCGNSRSRRSTSSTPRDLFFHQTTAAAHLRKIKKDPRLGMPPELKGPKDGRKIQVFDEDDDDSGIPAMWHTHPPDIDREENAKEIFVPAEIDERSPWLLFEEKERSRNARRTSTIEWSFEPRNMTSRWCRPRKCRNSSTKSTRKSPTTRSITAPMTSDRSTPAMCSISTAWSGRSRGARNGLTVFTPGFTWSWGGGRKTWPTSASGSATCTSERTAARGAATGIAWTTLSMTSRNTTSGSRPSIAAFTWCMRTWRASSAAHGSRNWRNDTCSNWTSRKFTATSQPPRTRSTTSSMA